MLAFFLLQVLGLPSKPHWSHFWSRYPTETNSIELECDGNIRYIILKPSVVQSSWFYFHQKQHTSLATELLVVAATVATCGCKLV